MTPTISGWFYDYSSHSGHVIGERVRLSLWDSGLFDLWLDVVSSNPPYKMSGNYKGDPVEIEWLPGEWLRLRSGSSQSVIVDRITRLLAMKPSWMYGYANIDVVWEWYLVDSEERWREISGNPIYQSPKHI